MLTGIIFTNPNVSPYLDVAFFEDQKKNTCPTLLHVHILDEQQFHDMCKKYTCLYTHICIFTFVIIRTSISFERGGIAFCMRFVGHLINKGSYITDHCSLLAGHLRFFGRPTGRCDHR
jgi:hypothetical protein